MSPQGETGNGKERAFKRSARLIVTGVLVLLFALMVMADICDGLWGRNLYEIPTPAYGIIAVLIGAVFGIENIGELLKPK
jgi:hypothetical protein